VVDEGCRDSRNLLPFMNQSQVFQAKFLTVFGAKQRFFRKFRWPRHGSWLEM
jgi:hypothetical protein